MGTSQSSKGAPSGVAMVPPWVPDIPSYEDPFPDEKAQEPEQHPDENQFYTPINSFQPVQPIPIALPRRFGAARRCLGNFASSGNTPALRRGLSHYIRNGYGGSGTAVRRFGGTIANARTLYRVLSPTGDHSGVTNTFDPALLRGHSVHEVMDALIEAVRPMDGTQDAEAGRAALRDALSDLLTRFPDTDLLNLSEEQRTYAIEQYVAIDVFRRFELDLGKTIQDKAPDIQTALSRLKEARDYIKEAISASFRKLRNDGHLLTSRNINTTVKTALTETFQVFEDYAL
jgi:hypothetical protein